MDAVQATALQIGGRDPLRHETGAAVGEDQLQPEPAATLAVSTAIAVMHLTRTLHPPGGATALIAVIGSEQVHALGYLFVLIPATLGPLLMLLVALLVNNLSNGRRYPEFWL